MVTEAQKKAKKKYDSKSYDKITFRIKKEDTPKLLEAIKEANVSKNSFILNALFEKIEKREGNKNQ